MRIITGEYKGRRLESPKDRSIRPTTDKVKEAIFSIIAFDIPDAVCVDLFAGTGNLGLEALSRGAARCYFGDKSRESIAIVRKNINMCGAQDKSIIMAGEYQKVLASLREKADIFFLDPPYKDGFTEDCISLIAENDLLAEDGIIIAEHSKDEKLPDEIAGFTKIKERKYGAIIISIYG
ncbi:MAG: 16S rRNA (guanine(966)-N(2))-methyltransferase RsmD [Firmicutes bacterium]|nr:16S rRNA (guanine(966)-N(2))-methyltransferase RsmD [Bacillota bacterium]